MKSAAFGRANEQLSALLKQHGHCDLLLDRTLGAPLQDAIDEESFSDQPVLLNPEATQVEPDACAILLRLSHANLALLDASVDVALQFANIEAARGRPVCAWLFGHRGSLASVAGHLRRRMIVCGPSGDKFLLRFYDPRVLPWLRLILNSGQLQRLLQPFQRWVWMDRDGQLHFEGHNDPAGADAEFADITSEQDAAIDQIELLNQCVGAMRRIGRPWPVTQDKKLVDWLQRATAQGHAERQDQLAYLLHAALVHPQFDTEPRVLQAIAAARRNGLGLCAALGEFDEAFWEGSRARLSSPPHSLHNDIPTPKPWAIAS